MLEYLESLVMRENHVIPLDSVEAYVIILEDVFIITKYKTVDKASCGTITLNMHKKIKRSLGKSDTSYGYQV